MSADFPTHPTAKPYPLLGHLPHLKRDAAGFLLELGLGHDISSYQLGTSQRYLINKPEILKEIWQSTRFERTAEVRKVLASVAGDGLLTQEGPEHRQHRRMMQPAFHRERLAGYFNVMIAQTELALTQWKNKTQVDVSLEMKHLALDIVTHALFSQEPLEEVGIVTQALEDLLPKLDNDIITHGILPKVVPVWFLGKDKENLMLVRQGLSKIIKNRRHNATPSSPPDLLDMLLETRDEDGSSLSDEDIAGQALTLMSAGFETTANSLTWAWYLLSQHPEVLQQVRTEVDSVLGGRKLTLEDLPKLGAVDRVLKETQRLYPVAWLSSRVATEEVVLEGHTFAKDSVFFLSPYVTHRDERYFKDPLTFNPDRFINESDIPKFAYLPFGAGVHQCIGNIFALWEMKVVLATFIQHLHLEPEPSFKPQVKIALTLGMETFPATIKWLS